MSRNKKIPGKYILSIRPKEYLTQGLSHCGAYSVKGILSAYGIDNKSHPKEYHPQWLGKTIGITFGKDYYANILRSYGIKANVGNADQISSQDKLNLLKAHLSGNNPIMLRIGNGFWSGKSFNYLLSRLTPHWITLWGYDDQKEIFYVYDSGLSPEYYTKDIPIGNTIRTYSEILRDWNFGVWHSLCWIVGTTGNYLYIKPTY